jgi:hypothetical protein
MWHEAFGPDRSGYSAGEMASDVYEYSGAQALVERMQDLELDRLASGVSLYSDGSIWEQKGLYGRFETPFVTIEANASLQGNVIFGDSNLRIGAERSFGEFAALAGTSELAGNFFGPSMGAFKSTIELPNNGAIEVMGHPLPPMNYKTGAALQAPSSVSVGSLTVEAEPSMAISAEIHGGPTAAVGGTVAGVALGKEVLGIMASGAGLDILGRGLAPGY